RRLPARRRRPRDDRRADRRGAVVAHAAAQAPARRRRQAGEGGPRAAPALSLGRSPRESQRLDPRRSLVVLHAPALARPRAGRGAGTDVRAGGAASRARPRIARAKGEMPDTSKARALYVVNYVELALVGAIVFIASFMARGLGPTF